MHFYAIKYEVTILIKKEMSIMANFFKDFFSPLNNHIKKTAKKQWRREKIRCNKCGNVWNCIFPNITGGEAKLQCPKCGKRDSSLYKK